MIVTEEYNNIRDKIGIWNNEIERVQQIKTNIC